MAYQENPLHSLHTYDFDIINAAFLFVCNIFNVSRPVPQYNYLTRFNKIATQGAPQMAVDKEANSLSRVYSYYSKFNLCLFYV